MEIEISKIMKIENKKELRRIIRNSFVIFFQNGIEVLFFSKLNSKNIEFLVKCLGLEYLNKALLKKKGAMLLFAHFGANQMIMPAIGYRGYKMSQLSAPPIVWKEKLPSKKFSRIEEKALKIRWEQELSLPVTHINIFGSLKDAFLCLKRNEVLGIAMDGGGGKDRVSVGFLNKKVLLSTGAIEIAIRTGCAVLPTFMIRGRDGRHKMIIEPPLELEVGKRSNELVERNTAAFVKRLEDYVLRYPCHYLNFLVLRTFMEDIDGIPFIIKKEGANVENLTH